jgi:hypothetical protein
MSHRSKYQQLPTEAINPATLGIDKASAADIIELMLNDDRKVLAKSHASRPASKSSSSRSAGVAA